MCPSTWRNTGRMPGENAFLLQDGEHLMELFLADTVEVQLSPKLSNANQKSIMTLI